MAVSLGRRILGLLPGIAALERAHRRFAGERTILKALATMKRDRGNRARALAYAEKFDAIAADDPVGQALLRELRR